MDHHDAAANQYLNTQAKRDEEIWQAQVAGARLTLAGRALDEMGDWDAAGQRLTLYLDMMGIGKPSDQ